MPDIQWDSEASLMRVTPVDTANDSFEPQKYRDTVRERVMDTIQRKVDGQDITTSDVAPDSGGKIVDLMEALKASLARTEEEQAPKRMAS